jgi:hypothetical protein
MYEKLLAAVVAAMKKFKYPIATPCCDRDVRRLIVGVKSKFDVDLPEGFLRFLRQMNGMQYNGLRIYSGKCSQKVPDKTIGVPGFILGNLGHRCVAKGDVVSGIFVGHVERSATTLFERMLIYGENDVMYFVSNLDSTGLRSLDNCGMEVVERYPTFDHMLAHALWISLNCPPALRPEGIH